MLSQKNRTPLRQQPEFFQQAKKRHASDFTVFIKKSDSSGFRGDGVLSSDHTAKLPTFAVIVSKKQVPKATDRHKIKRVIHSAMRQISSMPEMAFITKTYDIVIVARKTTLNRSVEEITQELYKIVGQM